MRCKDCKKIVKEPRAMSWKRLLCPKCFNKTSWHVTQGETFTANESRITTNPVDEYLDLGTLYELEKMR